MLGKKQEQGAPARPKTKEKDSPYDILAIPLSLLDSQIPGEMFKAGAAGIKDIKLKENYIGLLEAGYKIHSFSINNQTMYILFQK
jgi:predicted GNAT superfamily acetyltransferase